NARAYGAKGYALYGLKRYEEALVCYEQARKLDPTELIYLFNKGNALKELGHHAESMAVFEELLAAYEQELQQGGASVSIHVGKGNALYELKRYEEALAAYDQALEIDPRYICVPRIKCLYTLHRRREAFAAVKAAIRLRMNQGV